MLSEILYKATNEFTPVVDSAFRQSEYFAIDMSSANSNLTNEMLANPFVHHQYLQELLQRNNAKVAYGGYLEHRALYDRSNHFQAIDNKDNRNIHLGIDLWCPANTKVLSPLNGS